MPSDEIVKMFGEPEDIKELVDKNWQSMELHDLGVLEYGSGYASFNEIEFYVLMTLMIFKKNN